MTMKLYTKCLKQQTLKKATNTAHENLWKELIAGYTIEHKVNVELENTDRETK